VKKKTVKTSYPKWNVDTMVYRTGDAFRLLDNRAALGIIIIIMREWAMSAPDQRRHDDDDDDNNGGGGGDGERLFIFYTSILL